jgi:hypothetical protein
MSVLSCESLATIAVGPGAWLNLGWGTGDEGPGSWVQGVQGVQGIQGVQGVQGLQGVQGKQWFHRLTIDKS